MLSRFSRVALFETPSTIALQAPLSMGFSRQEHWSGLPCPPPGDLSDPGIEPASLMSPALAGRFFTTVATREALKRGRLGLKPNLTAILLRREHWDKDSGRQACTQETTALWTQQEVVGFKLSAEASGKNSPADTLVLSF